MFEARDTIALQFEGNKKKYIPGISVEGFSCLCGLILAALLGMKNIKFPVLFTTFYLIVYAMLPPLGVEMEVMLPLFIIGQLLVVWMVLHVLRHGVPSGKKFSDGHWYDDSDL